MLSLGMVACLAPGDHHHRALPGQASVDIGPLGEPLGAGTEQEASRSLHRPIYRRLRHLNADLL